MVEVLFENEFASTFRDSPFPKRTEYGIDSHIARKDSDQDHSARESSKQSNQQPDNQHGEDKHMDVSQDSCDLVLSCRAAAKFVPKMVEFLLCDSIV